MLERNLESFPLVFFPIDLAVSTIDNGLIPINGNPWQISNAAQRKPCEAFQLKAGFPVSETIKEGGGIT